MTVSLVGVAGSTRRPSRTSLLVRAIVSAVARRCPRVEDQIVELSDVGPNVMSSLTRAAANAVAETVIRRVETADVLVIGTPVYRASYTGALKHLFDLIHHDALAGKPVILAATGGSALHGLVVEHQLRPLMGFFGALSLPTAIYATEEAFADGELTDTDILRRIDRAAAEAAPFVPAPPKSASASPTRRGLIPADL